MNRYPPIPSGSGDCPVCHGTGWELYLATVTDYGIPQQVEFARRCSRCSGIRREQDNTGVPPEYHDADLSRFDFEAYSRDVRRLRQVCEGMLADFRSWAAAGKGLYLWSSTPGSGKTFLACCLAKSLMMKYDLQMRFVTVVDYLAAVGESYNRERGCEDPSAVYRSCSLLVLDDIGAQQGKEWHQQEMFRLTNERMANGTVTIYTSNLCTDRLNVDERTKDRIVKSSIELEMPEESIRRKKAAQEQAAFLNRVLI